MKEEEYYGVLIKEKDSEIRRLENALTACQHEIKRLRQVCREYENRQMKDGEQVEEKNIA
ncbi:MAG: hypothetical protein LUI87_12785 [Lachnospiraceae bacterium]|nr:hypothetical protein [Lachnospiraceae bacterium]